MTAEIRVAILGASGYGAGELLRLLTQHTAARVVSLTSTSQAGQPVEAMHPHLHGFYDVLVTEDIDFDRLLDTDRAVIFFALPHGASATALDAVLSVLDERGAYDRTSIIDLSGDFRLKDAALHSQHYPDSPLLPLRRGDFVYGLPELNRAAVEQARFIANPGCLATASILAAAPLMKLPLAGPLAVDAKTGSSGSGKALKESTHHPTRHADFRAYKPLEHQHEPEIVQALTTVGEGPPEISFVAQSMDAARGIFVTVHATLAEAGESSRLSDHYTAYYDGCPFVRVVKGSPTLQDVVGSNFCDVSIASRGRQVIVMAALDNLVKGMAGTAIQNMNLMCGLPETTGLWTPSLRPV